MQGLTAKQEGTALLVSCQGEVTFENTADIRQFVEKELAAGEYSSLILDLSEVGFMDSSGIGTLVALNSKVYSSGRKLYLMSPTEQVRKTLELVKLLEFFDFVDTPEDVELLSF